MGRDVSTTLDIRGKKTNFSRSIRTPFGVLLTFVPAKQKSLHYLSFRQTVAQQEGNLISTERSEWRNLTQLPISKQQSIYREINLNKSYATSTERSDERYPVYDDM